MNLKQFAAVLEPDNIQRRQEIVKAFTDLGFNETTIVYVPSFADPPPHDTLVTTPNWHIRFYPRVYYADGLNIVLTSILGKREVTQTIVSSLAGRELFEQYTEWAAEAHDDAG